MTLIVDAAPLVALADAADPLQPTVERLLVDEPGELVLPAAVAAEVDYLLDRRLGPVARRNFFTDLADGRFLTPCLDAAEYELLKRYDERYADLNVGLADLSVVILAHRFRSRRVLTFDQRHFRALRTIDGQPFVLLPADG